MTRPPDPDKTRKIRTPPPPPSSGTPAHRPPVPEKPWWQNVNREMPPTPAPPPTRPKPKRPPAPQRAPAAPAPPPTPPPRQVPVPDPKVTPPKRSARNSSRRRLLIRLGIGLVVLEAVVLVVVLSRLRASDTPVLDVAKAQRGVMQVLSDPVDGYGAKSVASVVCNNGKNPPVHKGSGFECDVIVDGAPRRVAVVFQDDAGTYAVDRPR